MLKKRISFNPGQCIQCHACETACKSWRNVETGVKYRWIEKKWTGEYPDVRCAYISMACRHCAIPACVPACPREAICVEPGTGLVLVDPDKCTGCGKCREACPFHVPQFGADGKMQKCDQCHSTLDPAREVPPCVATCPTGALGWG